MRLCGRFGAFGGREGKFEQVDLEYAETRSHKTPLKHRRRKLGSMRRQGRCRHIMSIGVVITRLLKEA
jgi:hypothetical protein